ncbi:type I methionyl aminopeptidase [Kineococcus sp. SYSU DK001]|uniref:type I methionyl aminopeptidase n=1 Tax=Kineococcus sp. SYSU DK001 TaxID=3383122 RepID=UPI003D7D6712
MVELKTPSEIEAMRAAGRVVGQALAAVRAHAAPGVRLDELDAVAREVIFGAGATSPFLDYQPGFADTPFPGVICASVNDAVLHGIPGPYELRDGDLLSVDCGAVLDGWAGDAATTFSVGTPRPGDPEFVAATKEALAAGIAAAVPGHRIGDVSAAIGAVGRRHGCGVNTEFGGHGVGRTMHEDPSVPNDGRAGRGMVLKPGLVIAVEPWFTAGGNPGYRTDDDGWTMRSVDGSQGAHEEHTVAVTADGPVVLTLP